MALTPGTRLGPHEITALLGVGGMGEVYRATDTNLKRSVAIKVLPAAVAADAERLARFQREAEVLAALNHPNIGQIHGLEKAGGTTALVLEFVDGPTLADRIAQGAIPLDEALPIGKQIAEALEAAHDQGVIHRDLKPANIKLRPDGTVKVLDFGLAKAMDSPAASPEAPTSPTVTTPAMTEAGMILGTAAYMSPEQARGRRVDQRADIWAFGCVLYEMLTGTQAFGGATVSDTIAALLRAEPDWSLLPADTPIVVRRLLQRCLVKDARQRLPHIGSARFDLSEPSEVLVNVAHVRRTWRASVVPWAAVAASIIAVAVMAAFVLQEPQPAAVELVRFEIDAPPGTARLGHSTGLRGPGPAAPHFAISPDGRVLTFSAVDQDNSVQLWVRSLASVTVRRLPGTTDASFPFWSPDGRRIGFFAGGALKTIALDGETSSTVCGVDNGEGGTWGPDGTILFAPRQGGIWRVPASGGTPVPVTRPGDNDVHNWPSFVADGRSFLYFASAANGGTIRMRSLESAEEVTLLETTQRAMAVAGHLLFVREGQLFAQPLDTRSRSLTGEPRLIVPAVAGGLGSSRAAFHASNTGVLVFRTGFGRAASRLVWWSRTGAQIGVVDQGRDFGALALAPDGSRAVVQINDASDPVRVTADLWTYDLSSGVRTRFTSDPGYTWGPAWSPDGQSIAYSVSTSFNEPAQPSVWIKSAGGAEPARKLADEAGVVSVWTPDGRRLVVTRRVPDQSNDVWLLPLAGGALQPLIESAFDDRDARYSPDGRWLTYISTENGQFDIYVQPVPATGRKWRASPVSGTSPYWNSDSRELFYSYQGNIYAVHVSSAGVSAPTVVLRDVVVSNPLAGSARRFAVSPDGQRFLTATPEVAIANTPITVVLHWPELLRR